MKQKRKRMRLPDYSYSEPGAYFITVCVEDHKCRLGHIVGADDHIDPYTALSKIGAVVEKYTRMIPGIDRYVIMPNHVHMILRISSETPGDGPMWSSAPANTRVPTMIRTWKTLISKELGESIFQRSYYDHVIRNERDYVETCQYMIGNPGKWYEDRYYCEN